MNEGKLLDRNLLRRFIPLHALSPQSFEELVQNTVIEHLDPEKTLFAKGQSDHYAIYLLSGLLVLESDDNSIKIIKGGSEEAKHPIDHYQPHKATATSKTIISYIKVEDEIIDDLLAWEQSNGYSVDEIDNDHEPDTEDWMTRVLRNKDFRRVPAANLQAMFIRLESVVCSPGEQIIKQNEEGDYYYLIKQGRCAVLRTHQITGEQIKLGELGPGESFGEDALVSNAKRNATVTALTDVSLMRLHRDHFERLLKEPILKQVNAVEAQPLLQKGAIMLDVRTEKEHQFEAINGSQNIPLGLLRKHIRSLDRKSTYIVYCGTGHRSAVAAYLLNERGFDVYVLEGGIKMQKARTQTG